MTQPKNPLRLHRHPLSGHCHRVELFLSILGLPYELVEVDLLKGAHKAPPFLAKNAFGQVPVLEDGDVTLADSNAILVYLALRYDEARTWLPADPVQAAAVQRWLSVAAGQLAYGPAQARLVRIFGAKLDHARAVAIASDLYAVIERHLQARRFLAGERPTLADLAVYSYTALANEGDVSLVAFPRVRAWVAAVEALPGFVAVKRAGAAA